MSRKTQIDFLDRNQNLGKVVLMLAWPVFIENLMQILVSYVDTAMVASIGTNATAAVAVNSSFVHLTQGLIMGIGTGYSVLVSRYIGQKRPDQAKEVVRQSLFFIAVMGVFMTLAYCAYFAPNLATLMNAEDNIKETAKNYLMILGYSRLFNVMMMVANNIHRGAGDTRTPMISNIANNLINMVGNFLLIYHPRTVSVFGMQIRVWGAGMEVEGAAIATSFACVISAMITFSRLYRKEYIIGISLKDRYSFSTGILKAALTIGIPVALDRVIISCGQMVITRLLAGLGNATLAAHNFANTAESMCYMPIMGFSVAAQTLVATSLGGKDVELAKTYYKRCVQFALGIMSACAVLMYIFAPALIDFFSDDPAIIQMGARALRIQAFAEPCFAVASVFGGVLKGSGDAKFSVVVAIIGMWAVRICMAVLLIRRFGMGLEGVWLPMAFDWYARAAVFFIRIKSGKWQTAWKIK